MGQALAAVHTAKSAGRTLLEALVAMKRVEHDLHVPRSALIATWLSTIDVQRRVSMQEPWGGMQVVNSSRHPPSSR